MEVHCPPVKPYSDRTESDDATLADGSRSSGAGPAPATGHELTAGTPVGEYAIERLVGYGSWGAVYTARSQGEAPRRVAIKVLHATLSGSQHTVERFVREVSLVRLLHHPSIVEIYDLGQLDDGRPYYVMEHLDGEPLSAVLDRRGKLPVDEAAALLEPVCEALAAAHEAGIVHRDVKPSNIMVLATPGGQSVKLIDFGVAKLLDDAGTGFTTVGRRVGTLSAMSPEQIASGQVDARTDVYALGILLYQLLTGKHPFWSDDEVELAWRHLEEPAPRPSARAPLPPRLDAVVLRALEKAPERRFDSAGSFFVALSEAVGGPISAAISARDCFAVGIHVILSVAGGGEIGAPELAGVGRALDRVEAVLTDHGYLIALAAGPALLGVRAVGADVEAERRAASAVVRDVVEALRGEAGGCPRLRRRLRLHVDRARMRLTPSPELVGGALADVAAWPASAELDADTGA
ncbi:MAG: serine/threonine protein kinase [Polyangiaceae bacterium]|nr:serine/threonine protein kinase [Polyangiaceae bacterium]